MYFLNDEERKRLLKGLLPKSRRSEVAEELRGWNWNQPPLEPVYDVPIALYEVAGKYCANGRDVYLHRVMGLKGKPNKAMITGATLHSALADTIVTAKRLIYELGVERHSEVLNRLAELGRRVEESLPQGLSPDDEAEVRAKLGMVRDFAAARIGARIREILAKQPYIGEDSLVSLALPVVVEQKLDGSFLGLSTGLSADALTMSEPMMVDLKFGPAESFHRLSTTGYAMVTEAMYEYPINLGCIVYVDFRGDRLTIRRDLHIIDDELRQWFIEERDAKMRMVNDERDPGVPDGCKNTCPYYETCHP